MSNLHYGKEIIYHAANQGGNDRGMQPDYDNQHWIAT
jgi:hypothetical protein